MLLILFWSVIAAAFIGPGTVTTAAAVGTGFGLALLWALLFSTFACVVLQEASARVTIVSGRNLGRAIRERFHGGAAGLLVVSLVLGAIVLGCAAYEAGNILGSVAGARYGTGLSPRVLTLSIGCLAGLLLFFGTTTAVARFLGVIVALMGVAFLVSAFLIEPPITELVRGTFVPSLPQDSGILVLGLIGTTVVPYNLFLGSGIAAGQKLGELRFGLITAVVVGGIISMGVLVVGTAIAGSFSFHALADALSGELGGWAGLLFSFGLFAAGLSSAITAPLAAAITARGLFDENERERWSARSLRYRGVWMGVLLTGVIFGLLDVRPIPAIILAQALNGVLLPFAAIFLLIIVNDRAIMGSRGVNHYLSNICMVLVVAVTIVLGVTNVVKAVSSVLGIPMLGERELLLASSAVTVLLAFPIIRITRRGRCT